METRASDVFVVSFPKAGTTWTQEITYLIKTELDFEKSREQKLDHRFPFLEFYCSETVCLSVNPSNSLSVFPSVRLSVCLYICLFVPLSATTTTTTTTNAATTTARKMTAAAS